MSVLHPGEARFWSWWRWNRWRHRVSVRWGHRLRSGVLAAVVALAVAALLPWRAGAQTGTDYNAQVLASMYTENAEVYAQGQLLSEMDLLLKVAVVLLAVTVFFLALHRTYKGAS